MARETLEELRLKIDQADRDLLDAFKRRMDVAQRIGLYKVENGMAVLDSKREEVKLDAIYNQADPEIKPYVRDLYIKLFELSRQRQSKRKFGVLGRSLPHSYSPMLHNMFQDEYDYVIIEKEPEELDLLFEQHIYNGFNVTIPYKKEAAARCFNLSDEAREVGSVNTVLFDEDGKASGFNTDIYGFYYLLYSNGIEVKGRRAMILGTGGASVAIDYVLNKLGAASITYCSRSGEVNYSNVYDACSDVEIIVNTTPVGMYPGVDDSPIDPARFKYLQAVVDIVYNPSNTKLLELTSSIKEGVDGALYTPAAVGGLGMLVAQGYKASRIFRGIKSPAEEASGIYNMLDIDDEAISCISSVLDKLSSDMRNIAIIGMPGCGKSNFAEYLSLVSGRELVDLDVAYLAEYGIKPSDEIKTNGEAAFRDRETALLRKFAYKSGLVISCGGGIVTREENYSILKANSVVYYIERPLSVLCSDDRPLSQTVGVEELYNRRKALYSHYADKVISVDSCPSGSDFLKKAYEIYKTL